MPTTRLRRGLVRAENLAILVVGIGCALRGMSYLPPIRPNRTPAVLVFLDDAVPLSVYAVLWLAVLPLSMAAVMWRHLWVPVMAGTAGLFALWTVSFLASWLVDDVERAWVAALSYATITALIGCMVRIATLAHRLAALTESIIRGQ